MDCFQNADYHQSRTTRRPDSTLQSWKWQADAECHKYCHQLFWAIIVVMLLFIVLVLYELLQLFFYLRPSAIEGFFCTGYSHQKKAVTRFEGEKKSFGGSQRQHTMTINNTDALFDSYLVLMSNWKRGCMAYIRFWRKLLLFPDYNFVWKNKVYSMFAIENM